MKSFRELEECVSMPVEEGAATPLYPICGQLESTRSPSDELTHSDL
jgi:hypothetical protein